MTNIFWPIKIRSKEWGHSHLPTRDRYRWLVFRLACPTVGRMIPNCAQSNYLMLVFFKTKFWAFEMQMQSRRNDKSQRKRNEWRKEGSKTSVESVQSRFSHEFLIRVPLWRSHHRCPSISFLFPFFLPLCQRTNPPIPLHLLLLSMLKKPGNQNRAQNSFFQKINQKKKVVFSQFRLLYNNNFNGFDDISFSFFILNQKYFSG